MDEKILSKYHRVKVLSEQGEPGERTNAILIMQKMQQKHPNIQMEHAVWWHNKSKEENSHHENQPAPTQARGFDWVGMANRAQNVFGKMMDFAENAFGVHQAADLVQRCGISKRYNSKSVSFTISVPEEVYAALCLDFNPEQQRVFVNSLLFRVQDALEEDLKD
tara:strand:+ start:1095 stop:1586 length:492 start_codon:yes stop_codon:yes gene_type:complete